jgi:hypothetical protein
MGNDMNGAWISGLEGECAARYLFGTTMLTGFLESECVHHKDARVAGHHGFPLGQHLGEAIPHHAPPAKAKVEFMRDYKREYIPRPVDNDGAVPFDRKSRIALEPSPRRGCVTTGGVIRIWAGHLDSGQARCKRGSRGLVVRANDERGAQTMGEYAAGVFDKHPFNLDRGIPAMRQQHVDRMFAPTQRIRIGVSGGGAW